uniref:Rho guanine nucleotide exchange factor 11-like n=1 Tax=Sinocyclocheilus grahami TaxID=75366 RepID=A0A672N3B7_SINGR
MSVRHPTSTLDRLSSLTLGDSERRSSPGQQRETLSDLPSDNAGTGLVQRCVVVERDSLGFGFTVCGERIKLVQNVRPVVRLVCVVVRSVFTDVCSSLTAGTYVALTLQGPPPSVVSVPLQPLPADLLPNHRTAPGEAPPPPPTPPTGSSTPTQRITGPKPLQVRHVFKTFIDYNIVMDGPFQDIELLKSRPAHMTVFMRYVFSQLLDPNPLVSPAFSYDIGVERYTYFRFSRDGAVANRACLVCSRVESRLHAQEDIRGPLSELQQQVLPDIQEQLQDYRSKQMMGLGSLFGESDLQQLDGDPVKERQVVDKQVLALWDVLSKHEEDRSSPLASAVHLYLRHSGIKLRDSKVFPGLMSEKEKWLPFFPKAKKLSSARREKDGDDKKRNPILKYIGKPRSTSQSIRPGSVRNIIQHEGQQLSSSSFGEDSMDSPTISVRLARSESLKAQGEGRRRGGGTGAESVPRSRSDVDMEDCEEREGPGLRPLHHSASSSASSSSARSLENPTPPYTPRSQRRMLDAPVALLPDAPALDEDVIDSQNWQETVEPHVLASLSSREIDRQAVIYELFTTEASHLRTLRVLDQVFYQKMQSVLSPEELSCIFLNLRHVYELHASLCEAMKKRRESPVVQGIGDIMLARFEEQVSHLCSQQSQALELIKSKRRKDPRFAHLIQECEASPHCRRLQLKDLLVAEMQRLTKYPLLLDNVIKHTETASPDLQLLQRAQARCRGILQAVNEVVRETEHRHRLGQYQRRLDLTPLERLANPVAAQFKNLDLTTKRMIHEGPLTWKVSKDKAIEVQALLLSDLLVLLQRAADERLVLRCPSRSLGAAPDLKIPFCPILRLDSALVRLVATDNKALYVISTSESQIYELVAGTSSEKNTALTDESSTDELKDSDASHNIQQTPDMSFISEEEFSTSNYCNISNFNVFKFPSNIYILFYCLFYFKFSALFQITKMFLSFLLFLA